MATTQTIKRPAVFVDRDGTVMEEVHYCRQPDKVRLFPGVSDALKELKAAGFYVILVTNQSGIARGTISLPEYEAVHSRLLELLGPEILDATYMCPDGPTEPSLRRKPAPGMLLEAAEEWQIDLATSWMIGDKPVDIECAERAGVGSILVRTGYGASVTHTTAKHVAQDLAGAVSWILARR